MLSREMMLQAIARMACETDATPVRPALIDVVLRDEAAFYARSNPFAVGDLVTPRKASTTSNPGEAHIVIAVRKDAGFEFGAGSPGNNGYGQRLDMRVLTWVNGRYGAFWVESAEFEAWTQTEAEAAAVDTAAAA